MEIYLVGGAVRDKLLDLPVQERDWVVVGASPQEMLDKGYKQVGKNFPVFLHPETGEEYALARTERKTGPGYKGFAFHTSPDITLEQDLERRDLTINAIAEAPDGTLVDPYGGQEDLQAGLLRHVSPAFAEDPVRILRVARFAARFSKFGFTVKHATNTLMRNMVSSGEVDHLVPERVWSELEKALATEAPQKFFTVLRGCGALAVLFPEIDGEYESTAQAHGNGKPVAALEALRASVAISADPCVRFGVLLHALDGNLTKEQRVERAQALCQRLRAPNVYTWLASTAIKLEPLILNESAENILKFMESAGAFKQTGRWQQVLGVYHATGLLNQERVDKLNEISKLAASMNAARLNNANLTGPAVGEAIRVERLAIVRSHLEK